MVNSIDEVYGSQNEYLKPEDVGQQFWTLTIRMFEVKKFNDGTSKIILTFTEWDKSLPLNVTNARAISDLYGHNPNGWVGRQIMLFTTMASFQGRPVLAIRIRAPQQMGQQQPQQFQQHAPVEAHPVPRQPGQMQPQANTGYNPAQQSPQRPLNQPQTLPPGAQPFAPITGDEPIPF